MYLLFTQTRLTRDILGSFVSKLQPARADLRLRREENGKMCAAVNPLESFLTCFHDLKPGGTSRTLHNIPVSYQRNEWSSSYDFLLSALPVDLPPSSFLDIGCGDGYFLESLKRRLGNLHRLTGADMSAGELRLASQRLGAGAELVKARAQQLPFKAEQFDFVISHWALMLMSDIEKVLAEIDRVLMPQGRLIAIVGAAAPMSKVQSIFLDAMSKLPRRKEYEDVRFGRNPLRTPDGIEAALSPWFRVDSIKSLELNIIRDPKDMWLWFSEMYDLDLYEESARESVKSNFLKHARQSGNSEEKAEHRVNLHYFDATRRQ